MGLDTFIGNNWKNEAPMRQAFEIRGRVWNPGFGFVGEGSIVGTTKS